ncbi:hypothetical protein [Streptomyces sp. NPDC048603]|uniref:hypothetical protein n=1 Tax=Streptomyces sp. NPDC048603 TaxID=3365577 RepID=UPI00371827E8
MHGLAGPGELPCVGRRRVTAGACEQFHAVHVGGSLDVHAAGMGAAQLGQQKCAAILRVDHRVVDVARQIREAVRAAVTSCHDPHGPAVTVLVTVARTV